MKKNKKNVNLSKIICFVIICNEFKKTKVED